MRSAHVVGLSADAIGGDRDFRHCLAGERARRAARLVRPRPGRRRGVTALLCGAGDPVSPLLLPQGCGLVSLRRGNGGCSTPAATFAVIRFSAWTMERLRQTGAGRRFGGTDAVRRNCASGAPLGAVSLSSWAACPRWRGSPSCALRPRPAAVLAPLIARYRLGIVPAPAALLGR